MEKQRGPASILSILSLCMSTAALVVALLALFRGGQDKLEAQSFVLRDEEGRMRASLKMTDAKSGTPHPAFALYDENQKVGLVLDTSSAVGGGITLAHGPTGTDAVLLGSTEAGTPYLLFKDPQARLLASLQHANDGMALLLSDAAGAPGIMLNFAKGPNLALLSEKGVPAVMLFSRADARGVQVSDASNTARVQLLVAGAKATACVIPTAGQGATCLEPAGR